MFNIIIAELSTIQPVPLSYNETKENLNRSMKPSELNTTQGRI